MKKLLALAAVYFANYPSENEIHFTKDEQAFFSKNDATNHGKSLRKSEKDEPEVTTITRDQTAAKEAGTPAAMKDSAGGDNTALETAQATLAEAKQKLQQAKMAAGRTRKKVEAAPEDEAAKQAHADAEKAVTDATAAVDAAQAAVDTLQA